MMKKFVLIIHFLSLSLLINAQTTYTSGNFATAGETFLVSHALAGDLLNYDFQQTDTNLHWGYDSLGLNSQENRNYIDPNNSGYQYTWITNCILGGGNIFTCPSQWNNRTNLCLQNNDTLSLGALTLTDVSNFFLNNGNVLESSIIGMSVSVGMAPVSFVIDYDDIDTVFHFPINYLNTDSATAAYTIDMTLSGTDMIIKRNQKRVNDVEGWGSLTTPYGNFPSVLKMKTLIYHNDSTWAYGFALPPDQTTDVIYQWFDPGYGIPVLQVEGKVFGIVETLTQAYYIDSIRCLDPNALFGYTPVTPFVDQSGDATVNFTNISNNSDSYQWDFGDGGTSSSGNPSHTFNGTGTYEVQLVAGNSACDPMRYDTMTVSITISDSTIVTAGFYSIPVNPCLGDTIAFVNTSTSSTQYFWNFGDGVTSSVFEPTHFYSSAGSYSVQLIASDGVDSDTATNSVEIGGMPVYAGADTVINSGGSAQLHASADPNDWITSWQFNPTLSCTVCTDPIATPSTTVTYIVNSTGSCGNSSDSVTVVVTSLTVFELSGDGLLKVYPNPVENVLNIEMPVEQNQTIEIINIVGEVLYQSKTSVEHFSVNLSEYPSGIYLLKISTNKEIISFKIVKK